jgi:hypothetical protein
MWKIKDRSLNGKKRLARASRFLATSRQMPDASFYKNSFIVLNILISKIRKIKQEQKHYCFNAGGWWLGTGDLKYVNNLSFLVDKTYYLIV